MSFKNNLREELDFQEITVKELAYRTGINKHSIDSYLGGHESMPSADVAVKIAQALHVSVEYLVNGKEIMLNDNLAILSKHREIIIELNKLSHESQQIVKPLIIGLLHAAQKNDEYSKK